MISRYEHKELHWVDLEQPTNEEILYIIDKYSLPPFIKEKIIMDIIPDEIDFEYDLTFICINFSQILSNKKIDNKIVFIVTNNFIITIHNKPIKALGELLKEIELDVMLKERLKINDNKMLFAHLVKSLYLNSQKQLIDNATEMTNLKKQLFFNKKKNRLLALLTIISLTVIILLSLYVIIYI